MIRICISSRGDHWQAIDDAAHRHRGAIDTVAQSSLRAATDLFDHRNPINLLNEHWLFWFEDPSTRVPVQRKVGRPGQPNRFLDFLIKNIICRFVIVNVMISSILLASW